MDRRRFVASCGAAMAGVGLKETPGSQRATSPAAAAGRMRVGTQQGPTTPAMLDYFKRHGVHVNPPDGAACRKWWAEWRRSIAGSGNFAAYPNRPAYAKGFRHQGQPVVISETGNWRIGELPPMGLWTPYGYGPIPTAREYLDR